jgi:starch synthase
MRILLVSSEVAPFAKAGGLGDVSAALPRQLAAAGHDVRLVMPMYSRVHAAGRTFAEVVPDIAFDMGPHRVHVSIYAGELPGTRVPVYFLRCPSLYDRPSIYGDGPDEHLRFGVLSWAALKVCQHLGFAPDIVHANDWQTALLPVLLRSLFAWDRLFAGARSVLTLHNLGHQGTFPAGVAHEVGLGPALELVHQDELRAGRFSFLLTGLLHAHAITTVSPTYAAEIQTPAHGVGLDPYLRARRDMLFGILNGIDDGEWNPADDPHLPHRYSADDLRGKAVCKAGLLQATNLPHFEDVPVVGVVSRLVWQKGFDLCATVLPHVLRQRRVQLVVLGTGEPRYEALFHTLAREFPRQVAYRAAFSEPLAHQIEAGADLFLMPSRYEPCGLNQLYSLRYGTPPIVHRTGGLADSVQPYDPQAGRGTGFVFDHFDAQGLHWALARALDHWGQRDDAGHARWVALQRRGMTLPLGWQHRMGEYLEVYRRARAA